MSSGWSGYSRRRAASPSCPAASLLRACARRPGPGARWAWPEVRGWVGLGDWPGPLEGQDGLLIIDLHGVLPAAMELLREEDLIEEDDIPVRSFFPENWLWKVEEVDRSSQ